MENLSVTESKNKITEITSVELCELINSFRKKESKLVEKKYTEKQHKDLMKAIRDELDAMKVLGNNQRNFSLVEYTDKKGEKRPCFALNRDGALQILNKE